MHNRVMKALRKLPDVLTACDSSSSSSVVVQPQYILIGRLAVFILPSASARR
jgi:hypothetical protein